MSLRSQRSPAFNARFSREAFEPLHRGDATIEIPLQEVQKDYNTSARMNDNTMASEKEGLYQRKGVRRSMKAGGKPGTGGYDGEEDGINKMGILYNKVLNSSLIVRYFVYVIPLGIILAIPMVIGATVGSAATLGDVRIVWLFMWLLVSWVGLWVSKLIAHYLPNIFQFLCGIVSAGTRKYALILKALEIQLSLVGWALISLSTFLPIMTRNPDTRASGDTSTREWERIVQKVLGAALVSSLIFLGERLFIQLISVNYHRKQFARRIAESKEHVLQLATLYDASRGLFPPFCVEFAEEDAMIHDTIDATLARKRKGGKTHRRSGSATPMRILRDAGRFGNKVTAAFGNVAQEITGKNVFNPDSARSVVIEALERNRSSEALARRLWLSLVVEGQEALYLEDMVEVLGEGRQVEAEDCFHALDTDANGDVSLDEMIMAVAEFGRERRAIANGMNDVDQAINVLDRMLCVVVFVAMVFTFIAFLNTSFVTTLATAGTALLSLSFVFSVTAQEVLGSCIFLFVKTPFHISDRVDLSFGNDQLIVEHISLLYTVFRRVTNHRTVQIPNIVLNTLWIENVTRSKAMREQMNVDIHFDTTLEDIQLLRSELCKFVQDKENSRDFHPEVQVEVTGVGNLDKLDLCVEVLHKSNWSNETLRAARRSKFVCALVLALRKVPIYGPGGGKPALGEPANPTYSVAIPDDVATSNRDKAAKEKEEKRMVPTAAPLLQSKVDVDATPQEKLALGTLNERDPAVDAARDAGTERDDGATGRDRRGSEVGHVEGLRSVLRRATTKGRRKSSRASEQPVTFGTGAVRVPTAVLARETSLVAGSGGIGERIPAGVLGRGPEGAVAGAWRPDYRGDVTEEAYHGQGYGENGGGGQYGQAEQGYVRAEGYVQQERGYALARDDSSADEFRGENEEEDVRGPKGLGGNAGSAESAAGWRGFG